MGGSLILLGLLAVIVAIICLIRPIRAIRISTRRRAVFLLITGVVFFIFGGALVEQRPSDQNLPDVAASQTEAPALKSPAPEPVAASKSSNLPGSQAEAAPAQTTPPPSAPPPQPASQVDAADYLEECGGGKFDFCKGKTIVWDGEVEKIVDKWTVQARINDKLRVEVVFAKVINPEVLDAGIRFRFAGVIASQGGVFSWETIKKATLLETFNTKADVRAEREAKQQAEAARKAEEEGAAAKKMKVDLETYRLGQSKRETAHSECQSAAVGQARYGARSDWFPNYSWSIKGKDITIFGKDVQMKNGFNAERYVIYTCKYNVDAKTANVISID